MIGTTLSHYRIVEKLGQGGMGVVYKAEDTKLDRTVAIKVLPSAALASDVDRERFYREARSAAALHHPNIATVFEIDEGVPSDAPHGTMPSPFIAMEFIDGRPLEDEVKDKPLKLERAKALAIQIAKALEEAHEKNIVHRDIKSANVMLTSKGEAKVLDFGLAKTNQSTMLTRMGSTLGTIAYMSPEQARGEEVDKRTDLWALGVVMYEMVSGRHPFPGDYEQAVVYSIMNEEHEPLTAVRSGIPMELERIVNKCLAKKAENRYQSASDLIVDLRQVDTSTASGVSRSSTISRPVEPTPASVPDPSTRPKLSWPVVAAALIVGAAVMFGVTRVTQSPPETLPLSRVEISLPDLQLVRFPTLSPTREYLAVQARDLRGRYGIYLRSMATGELQYIEGSEIVGDREFGFSPDGSRLVFTEGMNGGLLVVVIPSGYPEKVSEFGRFAFWEDDDSIVLSDDKAEGGDFYTVNLDGGEPRIIDVSDTNLEERYGNILKSNMPGSNLAFGHQLVRIAGGTIDNAAAPNLIVMNQKSGELDVIESNAMNPIYVEGGFLMYQIRSDDGRLVVRPVDDNTGIFTGQPLDAISRNMLINWGEYSASPDGDLLYVDRSGFFGLDIGMWMVDLSTTSISSFDFIRPSDSPAHGAEFSNDDKAFAYQVSPLGEGGQIFYYDLETGANHQYSFDGTQADAIFSPEGDEIYFTKNTGPNQAGIFRIPADNSAIPELVFENGMIAELSSNGRWMALTGIPPSHGLDLLLVDRLDGNMSVVDSTSGFPAFVQFSPDNRYLVYTDELPMTEVSLIVKSVTGVESYRLPNILGRFPRWSDDGTFIYYASASGVMRLPVRTNPTFSVLGPPETILATTDLIDFDVSSDLTKILVASSSVAIASAMSEEAPRVVWLQNWSEYLKKEVGE